jgi:hypothetical protein
MTTTLLKPPTKDTIKTATTIDNPPAAALEALKSRLLRHIRVEGKQ